MNAMHTRQAVLIAPKRFELREAELTPGPGQLLLKVAVCGLCNWEQNHWLGQLGTCPQTLGHEWAGTVAEIGPGVTGFSVGDPVTGLPDSLSAFADYLVVGASNCFKLGTGIAPAQALGEPLKCIVTVLRAAAPEAGDVGVVLGCGPMGLWCLQALAGRLPAALVAVDVSPAKLELARRFGATHTVNPRAEDAVARIPRIRSTRPTTCGGPCGCSTTGCSGWTASSATGSRSPASRRRSRLSNTSRRITSRGSLSHDPNRLRSEQKALVDEGYPSKGGG
jgi:threonine dehydrogenase-like Zn-dependent dehydrogenase